jgi:hypothetical protein
MEIARSIARAITKEFSEDFGKGKALLLFGRKQLSKR